MAANPALLSPCGLYCGVCGIYQATQDNNIKLLKIFLRTYESFLSGIKDCTVNDLQCNGCHSDRISILCQSCAIRDCSAREKRSGCHECDLFPCDLIENFPVPNGKRIILRAVPYRKKNGTEKWVNSEKSRYICPECNSKLYRGCTRCRECKISVNVDSPMDCKSI